MNVEKNLKSLVLKTNNFDRVLVNGRCFNKSPLNEEEVNIEIL